MAANYSVFTRIFGEDGLSSVFRTVGASAKSAFAPVTAFNKAVGEPSTTALGKVGSAADGVASKFRTGLTSISSWLPALGALGSAATLGGLIAMTRDKAAGFDNLVTSAQKLGASTKDLALWRYGAKLANVEAESLDKGLAMLNRRMFDAATGKNKDVANLFVAMKVPLRDARGRILGVTESLEDIAEAFKNTGNAATRDAMAVALFGKSGVDLIPFLIKGKAGIVELRAEMARFSGLTDQNREDLGKLDLAYKQLDKAGSGLATLLSAVMAPRLARIVDRTTDWLAANKGLIAQSLDRKLTAIGGALDTVGGAAKAIATLPFVAEFLKGADASTGFDLALGLLGLTMAGPVFAALQVVTGAIIRMNLALWANPWVLLAAAVIGAAYAIYANWGPIKDWFSGQMTAISEAFDRGLGSGLWEIFTRFNAFNLIAQAVNGLSKWLLGIDLFDAGRKLLAGLIAGIKSLLPDFEKIWAPIDKGLTWVGNRWSAGAAAANADGLAGNMPGDFNPMMYQPAAAPVPGAAPAALQKAEIKATIDFLNLPKGVTTNVESTGTDSVQVGRSMGGLY